MSVNWRAAWPKTATTARSRLSCFRSSSPRVPNIVRLARSSLVDRLRHRAMWRRPDSERGAAQGGTCAEPCCLHGWLLHAWLARRGTLDPVRRLPGQPSVARRGAPQGASLLLEPVHERLEFKWLLEQAFDGDPLERVSARPATERVRLCGDLEHTGLPS